VLADRLSADGAHTVLVLEYGGSDRALYIQMPAALSIPMNSDKYNWGYHTEAEPGLGGRRLHTPRGKCWAAPPRSTEWCSRAAIPRISIAGRKEGARGWGYRHVLPYFRRAEQRAEGAG